jgi:hypothetical protein
VLRRIFGLKRDEEMGEWRKLHKEELRDLHSSPSVIRIIKSRMRWVRHVARMGEKKNTYRLLVENLVKTYYFQYTRSNKIVYYHSS